MKIVHLTSVHAPFDVRIFQRQCRSLAEAGHEVVLIVPHERDELVAGVQVRALPRPRSRVGRMTRTAWRVWRQALRERGDIYHFHDPELIGVGVLLRACGKRVVYDVHEDVPRDILTKGYLPRPVRRVLSPLSALVEAAGAACYNGVVAVTPTIAARFPAHKTILVQNFPRLGELDVAEATPYAERPALAAYVGGLSPERGAREMVRALERVPAELGARLAIAGTCSPPSLEPELRALAGWRHVEALGFQSRAQVARLLGTARVGLVLYLPGPNHDDSQPNKLFEYMSAGLPVIASAMPRWRQIVDGAGCGLLVAPSDPDAVAQAIAWVLTHPAEAAAMGARGRQAVADAYHWEIEVARLLELYERIGPDARTVAAAPVVTTR